jgi:ferredoxin-NADP reductase
LISAGSGVTPMMSMTTYRYDLGGEPDICFVQCAKRPSELVFRRQLEAMARRVPTIKLHYVVTQDDPYDAWTGYRGTFNQLMLGLMAPDYLEREVYCCGP